MSTPHTREGHAFARHLSGQAHVQVSAVPACGCGCGQRRGVVISVNDEHAFAGSLEVIDRMIASLQEAKAYAWGKRKGGAR